MQVFEFHFNPPLQKKNRQKTAGGNESVFDSFCYEPENIYEKMAGSLYMAGLLNSALQNNVNFLENLAKVIKEKYYTHISSPEKSLRQSLRKANEYLESIARKGDVSWLGNINFSVLCAAAAQKGYEFNFTKVGDIKVMLLRNGQLIDIDQKLQFEGIEPYPLKIFGNIISGKMLENDIILVFTKEVFGCFENQNIISGICRANPQFISKALKEIINSNKDGLLKTSGIFLAIVFNKENPLKEKEKFSSVSAWKISSFKEAKSLVLKSFSFLARLRPANISADGLRGALSMKLLDRAVLKLPAKRLFLSQKIPLPVFLNKDVLDKIWPAAKIMAKSDRIALQGRFSAKNLSLISVFLLVLALGFFIFDRQEKSRVAEYQSQIDQIESNVQKAENYLIIAQFNFRNRKQASILLKQSLQELAVFTKISPSLPKNMALEIKNLDEKISQKLYELNKLKIIKDPALVFDFDGHEFVPQKMIYSAGKIYFFSPFAENIFELNSDKGNLVSFGRKTALAAELNDSVIFVSKSGEISGFSNGQFSEASNLKQPYPEFALSDLSAYYGNLYVLDNKNKTLVKYLFLGELKWSEPEIWLNNDSVKEIKSVAVDGSLWALTIGENIQRHYGQKLQQTLKFDIFPEPKNFSKIFTSSRLPYLYLLEPRQQRIVILNKSGQIESQIQSRNFDNLLDFAVSDDGKTVFLLNGLKVYKIDI